jgi:predicted ester cyclase
MSIATDSAFHAIGAGWMSGDYSGIESLMAPDVKYHMPPIGDLDRAGLVDFIAGFRQAFPDFQVMLDETIGDEDRVVWLWHCEATFAGESPVVPFPSTGKPSAASGTIVAHFDNGRIVEAWHHGDWLSWLQVPLG